MFVGRTFLKKKPIRNNCGFWQGETKTKKMPRLIYCLRCKILYKVFPQIGAMKVRNNVLRLQIIVEKVKLRYRRWQCNRLLYRFLEVEGKKIPKLVSGADVE